MLQESFVELLFFDQLFVFLGSSVLKPRKYHPFRDVQLYRQVRFRYLGGIRILLEASFQDGYLGRLEGRSLPTQRAAASLFSESFGFYFGSFILKPIRHHPLRGVQVFRQAPFRCPGGIRILSEPFFQDGALVKAEGRPRPTAAVGVGAGAEAATTIVILTSVV